MNVSVAKIWEQIKEQYKKMSKRAKIGVLVTLAVIIGGAIIISSVLNNKPYETLFTGLNATETQEILAKLQEMGIEHNYDKSGTISVPQEQELQVRAQLASEGYPKSGLNYDAYLNNVSMFSPQSQTDMYKLIALQNRLGDTIRVYDGVSSALVNISLAAEKVYVFDDDKEETTASVLVTMKDGESPPAKMVDAIVTLVSTSVSGLKRENVGVTDSTGTDLTDTSGSDTRLGTAQFKSALEQQIKSTVRTDVLTLLNAIYGADKVKVSVNCTVDVDKHIKEIMDYIPSGEGNTGVIDSVNDSNEVVKGDSTDGGVVGAAVNSDVSTYPNYTYEGDELYFNSQRDIDYAVSYVKEYVESESGNLTDLSLAVVVGTDRPDEVDVAQVKDLLAKTANLQQDNVDAKLSLYYSKFAELDDGGIIPIDPNSNLANNTLFWAIVAAGAFVTLLFIVTLIMLLKKRKNAGGMQLAVETGIPIQQESIPDIDITNIKTTREMELKKQIGDFADENPEISAQLIRTWLKGGDSA